jgi:hypothetical protein
VVRKMLPPCVVAAGAIDLDELARPEILPPPAPCSRTPAPRLPFEVENLGRGAQSVLTVALLTPEALEVLLH